MPTPSRSTPIKYPSTQKPKSHRYKKIVGVSALLTAKKNAVWNQKHWQWLTMGTILVTLPILVVLLKFPIFHTSKANNTQNTAIITPHDNTIQKPTELTILIPNKQLNDADQIHLVITYDPRIIKLESSEQNTTSQPGRLIIEKYHTKDTNPLTLAPITSITVTPLVSQANTHVTISQDSYIKTNNRIISLTGNSASITIK